MLNEMTTYGLGYYIIVEETTYQVLLYPETYTGIPAMGLFGIILHFILYGIEPRINPYLHLKNT